MKNPVTFFGLKKKTSENFLTGSKFGEKFSKLGFKHQRILDSDYYLMYRWVPYCYGIGKEIKNVSFEQKLTKIQEEALNINYKKLQILIIYYNKTQDYFLTQTSIAVNGCSSNCKFAIAETFSEFLQYSKAIPTWTFKNENKPFTGRKASKEVRLNIIKTVFSLLSGQVIGFHVIYPETVNLIKEIFEVEYVMQIPIGYSGKFQYHGIFRHPARSTEEDYMKRLDKEKCKLYDGE